MIDVAWLAEYPTLNGGEKSYLSCVPTLQQRDYRIRALIPPAGPLAAAFRSLNCDIVPFSTTDAVGKRLPLETIRGDLLQLLKELRPDMLHANSLNMGRISGPVVRSLQLPSLAHLRDIVGLSAQAIADLNCHSHLVAVSHAARNYHVAQGVSAEKLTVLYNGVDLNQFAPRPTTGYLHRELQLPPSARLIGTIGQLIHRKGQDLLLQAARLVAEKRPDWHYVIVGERFSQKDEALEYERAIRDGFATAPLTGKGFFLGLREDVPRMLNEFSLLVHPARQEPLGRVLLEGAASGLAIIAADVGGTREIFPDEKEHSALLIPPGDVQRLADALLSLTTDDAGPLRERLGKSARRRMETHFTLECQAGLLAELYREVVSESDRFAR